jgi:uncharacterized protein (TIGR04222 family)
VERPAPQRDVSYVTAELGIAAAGYLAHGRRRALLGAVVALRVEGAVAAGRPGAITQKGSPPRWADPVMRAAYRAVSTPGGMRAIKARMSVQSALSATRKKLVAQKQLLPAWRRLLLPLLLAGGAVALFAWLPWEAAGVAALAVVTLRWPRRTRAGRRTLRELRAAYPIPDDEERLSPWETGMIVAVHGTLDLPNIAAFAKRARLRAGGFWPDRSLGDSRNDNEYWGVQGGTASHGGGTP